MANYVLDGHHKLQAAANCRGSFTLPSFIALSESAERGDVEAAADILAGERWC
jgi:hypothetical protein